jgi:2-oxoglutarate ferredoxin oxidoreductase subunit alpha
MLVVEMNGGQMLDDVQRATQGRLPVDFFARIGGVVPFPEEILSEIRRIIREPIAAGADPRKGWLERMAVLVKN